MATEYLFLSCVLLILLGWTALGKPPKGLPPGPHPLPLLGNFLQLGKLPHRSLAALARRHGPVMALRLGFVPHVIISSPSAAKQVLQKHDQVLSHRALPDALRALNRDNLSMGNLPPDATWRSLRRICKSHVFSVQRLDTTQGMRAGKVGDLVSFLVKCARAEEPVDVGRAAFITTLNLISTIIFSEDMMSYDKESHTGIKDHIRSLILEAGKPNVSDYFPMLRRLDLQGRRRGLARHLLKMKEIFDVKIEDRGRSRFSKPQDFLQALLDANASGELDCPTIDALILVPGFFSPFIYFISTYCCLKQDLFTAGSDTSATTVEWAMTELLRSPAAMEKAHRDVAEAMEGSKNQAVEESDISRMSFLPAIVKETLRLHPPAPFLLPRRASETVQVADEESNYVYTIPKDVRIFVNAWAIGHDPSVWGSDAGVFRPERFTTGEFFNMDYRGQHMELIPFGAGRRICPGLSLASRMVHLILANLLWSFEWKLPEGMSPADITMTEKSGLALSKAEPLIAVPVLSQKGDR